MSFAPLRPISAGDRVAVVAPSGPFDRESFDRGLALIATRYQPVFTERLFTRYRYLAGPDAARRAELQAAFDDQELRAIFVARGGYGAMRLLEGLRVTPKPLVGFSDVTALHLAAQRASLRSLHGPVLTQLGRQPAEVVERCFALLEGRPVEALSGGVTLVPGHAEGPLLGGNLSVLTRLIGTPSLPDLSGAILLLEDVGERPYRIDRMLTHLKLAGLLRGIRGLALGDFTGCEEPDADYTLLEVLRALTRELGLPCASGFPIGHGAVNTPVVLGARVRLDATAGTLTFLEGLVA